MANVIKRMCDISVRIGRDPRLGKMTGRPWAKELANVIKRMCNISVRIERGPRLEKMGREALGPRISNPECSKSL